MQQHQILMQQRQLEMQIQQLEMQKRTIGLLGDVHNELIENNTRMIPPDSSGTHPDPGFGDMPPDRMDHIPPEDPGERDRGYFDSHLGPEQGEDGPGMRDRPPERVYGEKPPDQWG
jgi:hypothetical protein